jgi:predicted metal-binding protein
MFGTYEEILKKYRMVIYLVIKADSKSCKTMVNNISPI